MSGVEDLLGQEVTWAREKLPHLEAIRGLNVHRDGIHWELTHTAGLTARVAAVRVYDALTGAGFSEDDIRALGVSEATIKRVAPLRVKPA